MQLKRREILFLAMGFLIGGLVVSCSFIIPATRCAVCLAVLRRDGFVSLDAGNEVVFVLV